jgi:hypothetical protein
VKPEQEPGFWGRAAARMLARAEKAEAEVERLRAFVAYVNRYCEAWDDDLADKARDVLDGKETT